MPLCLSAFVFIIISRYLFPVPFQSVRDSEISDKAKIKMKSSVTLSNEEDSLKMIFQSLVDSQVDVESLMSALRYLDEKFGCTTISIPTTTSTSTSTPNLSSSVNSNGPALEGECYAILSFLPLNICMFDQH